MSQDSASSMDSAEECTVITKGEAGASVEDDSRSEASSEQESRYEENSDQCESEGDGHESADGESMTSESTTSGQHPATEQVNSQTVENGEAAAGI